MTRQTKNTWIQNLLAKYRQSNYWFALPTTATAAKIDMCALHPNDKQFPYRWMKQLLETPNPSIEVTPNPEACSQLKAMTIDLNYSKEKVFGFGYPLFVTSDPSKTHPFIVAPLFIWQLKVAAINETQWRISRDATMPIIPNTLLLHYLKKNHQLELVTEFQEAIKGNHINSLHLLKLSNDIALKLDFDGNLTSLGLQNCPTMEECQAILEDKGKICWAGVLGVYPPLQIQAIESLEAGIDWLKEVAEPFQKHHFTPVVLNPEQEKVLKALSQHQNLALTGGKGTGKIYTLTGLIGNALANGARTLVISKHPNQLAQLHQTMQRHLGITNLGFVLTDTLSEKEQLINAIQANAEATKKKPPFDEAAYQQLLNQTIRLRGKLDASYKALNQPIFEGKQWIEMVGKFLNSHYKEGKQLLNSQLLSTDYTFDEANYKALKTILIGGKFLYKKINTLSHPLETLHPDIFTQKQVEAAQQFTNAQIQSALKSVSELYHQYVMKIEDYSEGLQQLYENHYNALYKLTIEIAEDIVDYQQRYGEDFDQWGVVKNTKLRFFGLFSKKYANIRVVKKELLDKYQQLQELYLAKRYFDYTFSEIKGGLTFEKIARNLADFEVSLNNWKQQIPTEVHNNVQQLSHQTVHPDVDFEAQLVEIKEKLDQLILALNATELFRKPFSCTAELVVEKRAFLENITDQLENIKFQMRDFEVFHQWKSFWLRLNDANKKLIKAFIKTRPKNWLIAYNSWFFNHLLGQYNDGNILYNDDLLKQFFETHRNVRATIPAKIKNYWTHRQSAALRRIRKENKVFFNIIFNKRQRHLLEQINTSEILQTDFDFVSTLFPVWCTTPAIASEILPKKEGIFDLVIVMNADDVTTSETLGTLSKGKYRLVVGNGLRDKIEDTPTLMAYAKNHFTHHTITKIHQPKHPTLHHFANAALYQRNLQGIPPKTPVNTTQPAMQLITVNGKYDPYRKVNRMEIDEIIRFLTNLKSASNTAHPKIGIVCFTKSQRNAILKRIEETQHLKIASTQALKQWLEFGLEVLLLEDMVGSSFDILIVSTVISSTRLELLDALALPDGTYYMQQLLEIPTKALVFCTSWTKEVIAANYQGNKGVELLMTMMTYAQFVQEDDRASQEYMLQALSPLKPRTLNRNQLFLSQVVASLSKYFPPKRFIKNVVKNNITFDLIIQPIHKNEPAIAIFCDSLFWHYESNSYEWENQLRQTIKKAGYQYHTIWSANWWKFPDIAPKQLAQYLLEFDQEYDLIEDTKVETSSEQVASEKTTSEQSPETEETIQKTKDVPLSKADTTPPTVTIQAPKKEETPSEKSPQKQPIKSVPPLIKDSSNEKINDKTMISQKESEDTDTVQEKISDNVTLNPSIQATENPLSLESNTESQSLLDWDSVFDDDIKLEDIEVDLEVTDKDIWKKEENNT